MAKIDAKKIYRRIRDSDPKFDYREEIHCPMVLEVMNAEGTVTAFCAKTGISEGLFHEWARDYKVFNQCYQVGKALAKANWEEEGRVGSGDENFNIDHWRITGAIRYGYGRNQDKLRLKLNPEGTPYDQYKQIMAHTTTDELMASEVKQLMESINVGRAVHESFKLQQEIDAMKDDLVRMREQDEHNSTAIAHPEETD